MTKNRKTQSVSELKSEEVKQLEAEIAKLEGQIGELALSIDKVEDEKLEITNQLKRALADYHNLESNTQKRLSLLYLQSRKTLSEKLIPIVDDMSMAVKSKEEIKFDEKGISWADGVVELLNKLEKSLEEIGLQKYIPEIGSEFDPDKHEALTTIPGKEANRIYDVIQPGYILDDIVIRPSRVVVTK
jgi:molecular chaperone GrpE